MAWCYRTVDCFVLLREEICALFGALGTYENTLLALRDRISLSNLFVVLDAQSSSVPCLSTLKVSRLIMSLGSRACARLYGLASLNPLGTAGNSFARNLRTSMHEDMVSPSFHVWAHLA